MISELIKKASAAFNGKQASKETKPESSNLSDDKQTIIINTKNNVVMKSKKCTKCGKVLPLSEFNKNKRTSDGYQCQCRACAAKYNKSYYEKKLGIATKPQPAANASHSVPTLNPKLADFHPRELIEELRARNYKGKLYITREIVV